VGLAPPASAAEKQSIRLAREKEVKKQLTKGGQAGDTCMRDVKRRMRCIADVIRTQHARTE
jgi:hypothetical protein